MGKLLKFVFAPWLEIARLREALDRREREISLFARTQEARAGYADASQAPVR